jgi:hypothetical protein
VPGRRLFQAPWCSTTNLIGFDHGSHRTHASGGNWHRSTNWRRVEVNGLRCNRREVGTAPADIKAEHFADSSIDELCYTQGEAAEFCQLVEKRLGATRLTNPFVLQSPGD